MKAYDISFSLGDGLPGLDRRRQRRAQFAELRPGRLKKAHVDCQVRSRALARPDAPDQGEHGEGAGSVARRLLTLGPRRPTSPGYDHITSAIGAAMIGWFGTAMLCYVTPKEHQAPRQEGREGRRHRPTRSRRTPDLARASGRPWDDALSKARFEFRWRTSNLSLDPETAREFHDETPSAEGQGRPLLLDVRPALCSMKITRTCATMPPRSGRRGEGARSRDGGRAEFVREGAEIYRKVRLKPPASAAWGRGRER
jgi:phosphomethylpyrimidine synthase